MNRTEALDGFWLAVGDLFALPEVMRLRDFPHHGTVSRYDHTVFVAFYSYCWARRLGLDARSAARGAMLHDLFLYSREEVGESGWRMIFRHPEDAAETAARATALSGKERNIIQSHMWPLSRRAPHSREALLVNVVDTVSAVWDYLGLSGRTERRLKLALRRQAHRSPAAAREKKKQAARCIPCSARPYHVGVKNTCGCLRWQVLRRRRW